ncbi:uncharacterized protein LOC125185324 [Salvia hispanica]|uniref:uncharacterized protein LOC125185324 n=1 Tax=Salvia hispanica TaxID=49212 RepID=UPI0020094088|nr:uncharacterized protein LOC125185324 [Salvia hispanica]
MRGSSLGRSTTYSDDSRPLGSLELVDENSDEEYSTAANVEVEGRDAATKNAKNSKKDGYKRDARGRIYVQLRDGTLRPTGVVANICNKAFKHIVDPGGYSQAKLSEEYINHYWKEFEKDANCEAYDQVECKKAFHSQCKARYGDYIGYKRKTMKKPAYFTDAQWTTYTDAWQLPENIKVSERCSRNRRQGRAKAFGTHCNGCIPFEETVEIMTEENDGIMPPFVDIFGRTHTFKTKDSQGLVSERATQIRDDVRTRAEELRAEGVENPDLDAIFLERHGKVKKRKQIPGAGSATKLYFPSATSAYASVRSTDIDPSKMDELIEQRRT